MMKATKDRSVTFAVTEEKENPVDRISQQSASSSRLSQESARTDVSTSSDALDQIDQKINKLMNHLYRLEPPEGASSFETQEFQQLMGIASSAYSYSVARKKERPSYSGIIGARRRIDDERGMDTRSSLGNTTITTLEPIASQQPGYNTHEFTYETEDDATSIGSRSVGSRRKIHWGDASEEGDEASLFDVGTDRSIADSQDNYSKSSSKQKVPQKRVPSIARSKKDTAPRFAYKAKRKKHERECESRDDGVATDRSVADSLGHSSIQSDKKRLPHKKVPDIARSKKDSVLRSTYNTKRSDVMWEDDCFRDDAGAVDRSVEESRNQDWIHSFQERLPETKVPSIVPSKKDTIPHFASNGRLLEGKDKEEIRDEATGDESFSDSEKSHYSNPSSSLPLSQKKILSPGIPPSKKDTAPNFAYHGILSMSGGEEESKDDVAACDANSDTQSHYSNPSFDRPNSQESLFSPDNAQSKEDTASHFAYNVRLLESESEEDSKVDVMTKHGAVTAPQSFDSNPLHQKPHPHRKVLFQGFAQSKKETAPRFEQNTQLSNSSVSQQTEGIRSESSVFSKSCIAESSNYIAHRPLTSTKDQRSSVTKFEESLLATTNMFQQAPVQSLRAEVRRRMVDIDTCTGNRSHQLFLSQQTGPNSKNFCNEKVIDPSFTYQTRMPKDTQSQRRRILRSHSDLSSATFSARASDSSFGLVIPKSPTYDTAIGRRKEMLTSECLDVFGEPRQSQEKTSSFGISRSGKVNAPSLGDEIESYEKRNLPKRSIVRSRSDVSNARSSANYSDGSMMSEVIPRSSTYDSAASSRHKRILCQTLSNDFSHQTPEELARSQVKYVKNILHTMSTLESREEPRQVTSQCSVMGNEKKPRSRQEEAMQPEKFGVEMELKKTHFGPSRQGESSMKPEELFSEMELKSLKRLWVRSRRRVSDQAVSDSDDLLYSASLGTTPAQTLKEKQVHQPSSQDVPAQQDLHATENDQAISKNKAAEDCHDRSLATGSGLSIDVSDYMNGLWEQTLSASETGGSNYSKDSLSTLDFGIGQPTEETEEFRRTLNGVLRQFADENKDVSSTNNGKEEEMQWCPEKRTFVPSSGAAKDSGLPLKETLSASYEKRTRLDNISTPSALAEEAETKPRMDTSTLAFLEFAETWRRTRTPLAKQISTGIPSLINGDTESQSEANEVMGKREGTLKTSASSNASELSDFHSDNFFEALTKEALADANASRAVVEDVLKAESDCNKRYSFEQTDALISDYIEGLGWEMKLPSESSNAGDPLEDQGQHLSESNTLSFDISDPGPLRISHVNPANYFPGSLITKNIFRSGGCGSSFFTCDDQLEPSQQIQTSIDSSAVALPSTVKEVIVPKSPECFSTGASVVSSMKSDKARRSGDFSIGSSIDSEPTLGEPSSQDLPNESLHNNIREITTSSPIKRSPWQPKQPLNKPSSSYWKNLPQMSKLGSFDSTIVNEEVNTHGRPNPYVFRDRAIEDYSSAQGISSPDDAFFTPHQPAFQSKQETRNPQPTYQPVQQLFPVQLPPFPYHPSPTPPAKETQNQQPTIHPAHLPSPVQFPPIRYPSPTPPVQHERPVAQYQSPFQPYQQHANPSQQHQQQITHQPSPFLPHEHYVHPNQPEYYAPPQHQHSQLPHQEPPVRPGPSPLDPYTTLVPQSQQEPPPAMTTHQLQQTAINQSVAPLMTDPVATTVEAPLTTATTATTPIYHKAATKRRRKSHVSSNKSLMDEDETSLESSHRHTISFRTEVTDEDETFLTEDERAKSSQWWCSDFNLADWIPTFCSHS
ncbi:hypothetical protein FisN_14Lh080 [Fistulifera solaris]|uniref:Uncharacterized protein n=1 Tax=Fistulifera solaris TaxID=1519565 RepID=A0A1Z5J9Z4_FISSO|nr:hypothetical protein FisN_14Lh080 [Fistulifera solaris]|eukprot:GAX10581.1 hypothetical protein FisN_14Lh080 [Fistulifera solaris]